MYEEIRPNLYRLEIPLPDNPLKYVNSYVIKGDGQCLIVDTGLNRDECYEAMMDGLNDLNVDLAQARFFITHLHADHFGLVARLATDPGQVYFSRPETEIIESWSGWEPMIEYAARNGFPEDQLREALKAHPGFKYSSKWVPDMRIIEDGETIEMGDYVFTCVWTPGHSTGHICLYEEREKILLAGDHILGDITPNIQCWSDGDNNLLDYMKSLDKVAALDVDLVLPGHRTLIPDMYGRIEELRVHHKKRLDEIIAILRNGPRTAFDTASVMKWDLNGSWSEFPLAQKWFATAEATAHLRYLEDDGSIQREESSGRIVYGIKG
jgi:glyoxylase-like metal-dependent hydrolase (beta-lactamase superfamily II)